MKKLTAALFFSLFSLSAHADIIKCDFTEPFFTLVTDTEKKTIVKEAPLNGTGTEVISRNAWVNFLVLEKVSVAIHIPTYAIMDGKTKILHLKLNYRGSNGMSDHIYPYDALYIEASGRKHFGGCESEKIKRFLPAFEEDKDL